MRSLLFCVLMCVSSISYGQYCGGSCGSPSYSCYSCPSYGSCYGYSYTPQQEYVPSNPSPGYGPTPGTVAYEATPIVCVVPPDAQISFNGKLDKSQIGSMIRKFTLTINQPKTLTVTFNYAGKDRSLTSIVNPGKTESFIFDMAYADYERKMAEHETVTTPEFKPMPYIKGETALPPLPNDTEVLDKPTPGTVVNTNEDLRRDVDLLRSDIEEIKRMLMENRNAQGI